MKRPFARKLSSVIITILSVFPSAIMAQEQPVGLSTPEELQALDMPNDGGERGVFLTWKSMPYDSPKVDYVIFISEGEEGTFEKVTQFRSNEKYKADKNWPFWAWDKSQEYHFVPISSYTTTEEGEEKQTPLEAGKKYYFRVMVTDGTQIAQSGVVSAIPKSNLFNLPKLNNFVYMVIFCAIILGFIARAKKRDLFLRRIPGLNAVEEAIGRATEMGRPIYFLTGRLGLSSVSTIAATIILGEVAKKVASYDAQLKVPHTNPIVMVVCQETVKQAYDEVGRPDAYQEDSNFFVTEDQFSYAIAVDGMMIREKPAACFFMGYFYAESLLLAEVGSSAGAIQVAGTDAEHQLPFFVTACDYTLIGEELYAATAYLSREPSLVGALRGQDMGKASLMSFVTLGVLLTTLGVLFGAQDAVSYILELFSAF